ncbi:MAG: ImmA/IrrE family metallo-endopeptidase [Terracidiphilus sp.]|nr:ImmA/IrrE family metallo-endopeptidase [Terracidiphilus sp.]
MRPRVDIEQRVASLLVEHGITEPPIPAAIIAKNSGLHVIESPIPGEVSGALLRTRGMTVIAVNSGHHPNRRRFTIAHELGHYFLNHEGEKEHLDWTFTVLRRDGRSSEATDDGEIEANFFAANLLMPKAFLREDISQLARFNGEVVLSQSDVLSLARRYEVSELAMTYRLISLGFIDPIEDRPSLSEPI